LASSSHLVSKYFFCLSTRVGADEKKAKKRGVRKPRNKRSEEVRTVVLKVTCEGKEGVKEITAKVGKSIGLLKHDAVVAFDAPVSYNVFFNGERLEKAAFDTITDGALIHLNEAPPATA